MNKSILRDEFLVFDGAMGTYLQGEGLALGDLPEALNMTKPELIQSIHKAYLKAGADVITTNTFGANALKVKTKGYEVDQVIGAAVANAQKAIGDRQGKYIALDIGPLGQLIEPMGNLSFDEAYQLFKEQVIAGEATGCDLILLETFTDIFEAKIAVLAAKENTNLPVVCTMSYEVTGRTFMGTDVKTMATVLEGLGVDAMGFNCSFGPEEMIPLVETLLKETNLPLLVQPNAGLPKKIKDITVYTTEPESFKETMTLLRQKGVNHLGGCCGTNENYIKPLRAILNQPFNRLPARRQTRVSSYAKTIEFDTFPVIIGERLNPTGKKRLKEAIINQDFDYMIKQAMKQVEEGAKILDVNIGLPEIDEADLMPQVLKHIQSVSEVPLQIDSSSYECLEASARYYNGIPLINSVSGKEESLNNVLPIVKKYGAAVVGLTLDDSGIPAKAADRFKVAEKIVKRAEAMGIDRSRIIIDCLALTASAQQEDVVETLKAIEMVKEKLGVKTSLGVSNVSFGLPYRQLVNVTFFTMALYAGLDAAIINPSHQEMREALDAFNVLMNKDHESQYFIQKYGHIKKRLSVGGTVEAVGTTPSIQVLEMDLPTIIRLGLKESALAETEKCLEKNSPMTIVDDFIIPALNDVGDAFEKGEIFLPQLIQSAETVQQAFDRLKIELLKTEKHETQSISKGKIVLATVQHDVHDIGKNIVKVILENYGYDVIDLGKDVPPEKVLEACQTRGIRLVGLSALMTSTVESMAQTINLLKTTMPEVKVIVGGAVLNKDYAEMIHADYYAKDARETAVLVNAFYNH